MRWLLKLYIKDDFLNIKKYKLSCGGIKCHYKDVEIEVGSGNVCTFRRDIVVHINEGKRWELLLE